MKKFYIILFLVLGTIATQAQPLRRANTANRVQQLEQPQAKPATSITDNAFTANWEPVADAVAYCVYTYVKNVAEEDGLYTIIDEDFLGITQGSIIEPAGGDEMLVELDDYTVLPGWMAYAYPTFIPSMVDGLLYSPYLDLRNDDGKYRIVLHVFATDGDEIRVESNGINGKEIKTYQAHVPDGTTGISVDTLYFDNGTRDLFFSVINMTAQIGMPDYVDRVEVLQQLKKGDEVFTQVALDEAVEAETEWGDAVTSKRFDDLHFAYGVTDLYYDLYAVAYDFSTPNGSTPYTTVFSPYSEMVYVDLKNHHSELGISETVDTLRNDDAWYTIGGVRVDRPKAKGIYIRNGKKWIVK